MKCFSKQLNSLGELPAELLGGAALNTSPERKPVPWQTGSRGDRWGALTRGAVGRAWLHDVREALSVSAVSTLGRGMGGDDMPAHCSTARTKPPRTGSGGRPAGPQCSLRADHSWAALPVPFCPFAWHGMLILATSSKPVQTVF